MKKPIYLLVMVMVVSGCATAGHLVEYFKVPKGACYDTQYGWVCNERLVEFISEPAGAKIEINNDLVGVTPFILRYNGEYIFQVKDKYLVVTVYPIEAGQYTQTKIIDQEKLPSKVYFDLHLAPTHNVDINYR